MGVDGFAPVTAVVGGDQVLLFGVHGVASARNVEYFASEGGGATHSPPSPGLSAGNNVLFAVLIQFGNRAEVLCLKVTGEDRPMTSADPPPESFLEKGVAIDRGVSIEYGLRFAADAFGEAKP